MTVRLTWRPQAIAISQKVYRSTSPFNSSSLPAVLAILGAGETQYEDQSAPVGETAYYMVETVSGLKSVFSSLVEVYNEVSDGEEPPAPTPTLPPFASATHWRLVMTANSGGAVMSLGELRMFDIDRNYIANVGTPSATSTYSGFNVSAAYDNDNGTLWAGANTTPEDTITFVYDSAVEPVEIEVKARASGSQSSFNQTPSAATLQYSTDSGVTWQDWISYTGQSFTAYGQSKFFLKPEFALANNLDVYGGSYPFWRVEFAVGDAVSVSEIEWRGSSGGVNLATGGTATASNTFSGFNVDNAFDGDTSTSWASAVGSTQSVTYEFTEAVECTHIALTPRSGFVSQAPSDIKIYVSVNGVDWALWDDTIPTQTGWTDLEEREIALTRPASSFP